LERNHGRKREETTYDQIADADANGKPGLILDLEFSPGECGDIHNNFPLHFRKKLSTGQRACPEGGDVCSMHLHFTEKSKVLPD
jgi:hypothetical protein